jgi:ribosomal protein S12 methylthiotransferase
VAVHVSEPLQIAPLAKGAAPKGTYAFVSLGCAKNLVDSERMLGLLRIDGYQLVAEPRGADFVVVNTCGFIDTARQESYGVIREMLDLKRRGDVRGVIVSGCLAEREKERLLETCPEIDQLVGVFAREEITKVADRLIGRLDEQRHVFRPAAIQALSDRDRLRITPRHYAYLKISEGCDRLCTFCAIPKMRGKHVTKPMEEVVAEAQELAANGVRELVVVAQDTTYYGIDLYGQPMLAELLRRLESVAGIEWVRLLYLYPMYVTDELIGVIAGSRRIIPYLDLPLQHINDTMLRRMQRRVARGPTEELIARLRERIPGLVMRTTFIVGFPGETEEQFEELDDFVRAQQFERMGVFVYSYEADTPSARLADHLPDEVKEERRQRLMASQQEIAFAYNERQIGRRHQVLIDQALSEVSECATGSASATRESSRRSGTGKASGTPHDTRCWIGRTYADAPEIDGVVYVTGRKLRPGQIVPCEIVANKGYDLVAAVE